MPRIYEPLEVLCYELGCWSFLSGLEFSLFPSTKFMQLFLFLFFLWIYCILRISLMGFLKAVQFAIITWKFQSLFWILILSLVYKFYIYFSFPAEILLIITYPLPCMIFIIYNFFWIFPDFLLVLLLWKENSIEIYNCGFVCFSFHFCWALIHASWSSVSFRTFRIVVSSWQTDSFIIM